MTDTINARTVPVANDCLDALRRKYGQEASGTTAEQWITLAEARSGAGHQGNNRQCDLLAINSWPSQGLQVIGHEIKVSMTDWKRELADPSKAEHFARYCRRWWVVVPTALAAKIKDEVPPTWGLMSVSDGGRCTTVVSAPAREPEPIPAMWWVGWMAQLDRQDKRLAARARQHDINVALDEARKQWEKGEDRRRDNVNQRAEDLTTKIRQFRDATGIDLNHAWSHDFVTFGELWKILRGPRQLSQIATNMRSVAESIDQALNNLGNTEGT
jgi:hypothetical protein